MEKKTKTLSDSLKSVIIYRDDIEKIIEILKTGGGQIEIENRDYKFNSLDELESLKEDFITDLELKQSNPYVSITFSRSQVFLYAEDDTPASFGIFEQIRKYVLCRRRKLAWLTENGILSGACIGASSWFIFFANYSLYNLMLALSVLALGVMWSWNSFRGTEKRFSIIYPSLNRKERFGLFYRKKDDIWIAVIAAGFGALITLLLTSFFNML